MSPPRGRATPTWRRFLPDQRQVLWGVLGAFLVSAVLVGVGYALTPIPNPNAFALQQATTIYYSDGRTPIATLGQTTRVDVPLTQVPVAVRHAVLAAEDRQFFSEPGISPTGILRALFTDIRGGEISQGGSTITQQYVKNAYLTQQRTFTRKFKEIFISIKLANTRSKRTILEDYLNTIYFGRDAYGIEAAAKAYFGEDVSKLNAAQGAVLAATISSPSFYDPAVNRAAAVARWHYVINGMAKEHWLGGRDPASIAYPHVVRPRPSTSSGCTGYKQFICAAVKLDLAREGFDEARLALGGYKVITTIDKNAENAAVAAMAANGGQGHYQRSGPDRGREAGLVSVQPGDGAIRAMYGGDEYCEHKHPDDCVDLTGVTGYFGGGDYIRPPGSSFKPYTLIAALQKGISLDSTYPGPRSIQFQGTRIQNSEQEDCLPTCTLTEALARSINTIFVPLAQQVGPDNVANDAYSARVSKKRKLLPAYPEITLGTTGVSMLDQANAYATIAAQGRRATPYLVSRVETRSGSVVFRAHPSLSRAFAPDVMSDTTYAMTKVLDCGSQGTACGRALPGRPAAGKTGTNGATNSSGNTDAWFIGFTPQLSTAVWYGNSNPHKIVTDHGGDVYGAGLPALTWQQMMTAALAGKPALPFPAPAHIGKTQNKATPSSKPSSPSPSSSVTVPTLPSNSPSPSPSPSQSGILPSSSPSPSPSSSPTPTTSANAGGTPAPAPHP